MNQNISVSSSEAPPSSSVKNQSPIFLELGSWEEKITKYILEMRYLTLNQITKIFANLIKEDGKDLSEILFAMNRDGIIGIKKLPDIEELLYVVTPLGYEKFQVLSHKEALPNFRKSIFSPRVRHDLLLNDLRISFEEYGFLKKWVSETVLEKIPFYRGSFQNLPDAVCKKKNDKGYFLELEVSKKSPKQYAERIAHYMEVLKHPEVEKAGIEGVIFVCTDEKVVEMLNSAIPKEFQKVSVFPYSRYQRKASEYKGNHH